MSTRGLYSGNTNYCEHFQLHRQFQFSCGGYTRLKTLDSKRTLVSQGKRIWPSQVFILRSLMSRVVKCLFSTLIEDNGFAKLKTSVSYWSWETDGCNPKKEGPTLKPSSSNLGTHVKANTLLPWVSELLFRRFKYLWPPLQKDKRLCESGRLSFQVSELNFRRSEHAKFKFSSNDHIQDSPKSVPY